MAELPSRERLENRLVECNLELQGVNEFIKELNKTLARVNAECQQQCNVQEAELRKMCSNRKHGTTLSGHLKMMSNKLEVQGNLLREIQEITTNLQK